MSTLVDHFRPILSAAKVAVDQVEPEWTLMKSLMYSRYMYNITSAFLCKICHWCTVTVNYHDYCFNSSYTCNILLCFKFVFYHFVSYHVLITDICFVLDMNP